MDSRAPDPERIIAQLHVSWGHASPHQSRRVSADSVEGPKGSVNYLDAAVEECEICGTSGDAPHFPIASTSVASAFNRKLHVDFLFLADAIAPHAMGVFSKYPLLATVCLKNPQAARIWLSHLADFYFRETDMHSNGIGQ